MGVRAVHWCGASTEIVNEGSCGSIFSLATVLGADVAAHGWVLCRLRACGCAYVRHSVDR